LVHRLFAGIGGLLTIFVVTQALSPTALAQPSDAETDSAEAGAEETDPTAPGTAEPVSPAPADDPTTATTAPPPAGPSSTADALPGLSAPGKAAGPPDPTPEQLRALEMLQQEADAYSEDARNYRSTLTRIIKHHYEEKRRRILAALDREIATETAGLKAAREEAIKRLEAFVAKYSGPNAHPESTPDAMFRLAALYEEREREASDEIEVAPGEAPPYPDLDQAIALYKRIIVEFPKYRELAGVFYYLGHAYNDVGRIEEAQQVWRSLVCRNHFEYPVPPDPEDPKKDSIARLPQDHPADWWLGWMSRHPMPLDEERGDGPQADVREPAGQTIPEEREDEEVFVNPYPYDCKGIPQELDEGEDPRYLAEIWWRLGDFHFEEIDAFGGPYNLNRAEVAYRHAMEIEKPPVYDVSMYKLAWTFFKQQRYQAAVEQFVDLLLRTDEMEKKTGNPQADFRSEAYAYIAGSLTYLDFDGPAPNDPYIARNDIFDLESDGTVIEDKMHVAIDRVQDPELIPQDKKWTIKIYQALAFEFKEYNHFHNLIELDEMILAKWPMHRDAPLVQNQIAETYEQLAGQTRGEEHEKYAAKALDARGKLVNYVATPGVTPPWVEANKEDPEAIRRAEQLVRSGLRRAAADHTNAARRFVQKARAADGEEKTQAFEQALREYRLAAKAWGGYLLQDENAEDAYESRFWLADAYTNAVLIQTTLGQTPNAEEIELARRYARDVRDSNEDNKYLQPAAMMVVRIAQQLVQLEYKRFEDSGGSRGIEKRTALKETGEGEEKAFVTEPVPQPLVDLVGAFDEYIARVPISAEPNLDEPNHHRFAYLAGEIPFLYGQFEDARKRLYPIYQTQCGQTEFGYLAWEKLITMANKENNFEESRKLAKASQDKSCAVGEDQKLAEAGIRDPTIQRGYFQEAADAYKKAQAMAEKDPDSAETKAQWRKAAELYEGALREAPERKEAPEAAILGASAYKQIGEYDKAISMYELFIKEYGSEERLSKLEKGDPSKGVAPNKEEVKERVKFLKVAYDALAEAYVLFFDYNRAAQTYEKIAGIDRFEDQAQREAARNAVFLYANIGDRTKMDRAKNRFFDMKPSAEERAEVEWLAASADLKQWDAKGPNSGSNAAARQRATASMDKYYRKFKNDRAADAYTVQAAYHAAKLARKAKDPRAKQWCDRTMAQFDSYMTSAGKNEEGKNKALGSIQADMAAECDYRDVDADIEKNFDYDSGHQRFAGVIDEVKDDFKDAVENDAKGYYDRLQRVIDKYVSRRWAVAARARQGSLYDSARTGLYNARAPALKLYSPKEEKLLKQLDDLCVNQGSDQACEKYDIFTANRRTKWRQTRDQDLAAADKAMVRGYVESILWAKDWKVRVDAVDHAIARLAFFTTIIGDDKLRQYSTGIKNPKTGAPFSYQDGMFLRMRRGLITDVEPQILIEPLPAIPASP
jgi:tetratricopeptide (TPR) repeat protein